MYFVQFHGWPRGLMDKASDFGSEDCEFESRRGHCTFDRIRYDTDSFNVQGPNTKTGHKMSTRIND